MGKTQNLQINIFLFIFGIMFFSFSPLSIDIATLTPGTYFIQITGIKSLNEKYKFVKE